MTTSTAGRTSGPRVGLVSPALVAAAAESLPAPSAVVQAALASLDDGRASLRHTAERVAQSPELAAQVMRVGSAAAYGSAADTLDQAVVRIGVDSMRALLMAAQTYPLLARSLAIYGTGAMALVGRANDVAEVSGAVADRLSPAAAPAARIAGLLHDIGMPILQQVVDTAGLAVGTVVDSPMAERALFGTDHARVGAWIARRWRLSDALVEAIEHHHATRPPEGEVAVAVWLGIRICAARSGVVGAAERLAVAADRCGLAEADLEWLVLGADGDIAGTPPDELTDREFQVLRMLAEGLAPKQVALRLGCSPSTIHNHLHHVYGKLGVSGQAHALLLARERGWV